MPTKKGDVLDRLESKLDLFKERFDEHVRNEDKLESKVDLIKEHIDNHMVMISSKMEKFDDRLDRIDVTGAANKAILDEHVRRTNLLEEKLHADTKALEQKHDDDVAPLKVQSEQMKIAVKILLAVIAAGGLSGGAFGIKKLIEVLFGG